MQIPLNRKKKKVHHVKNDFKLERGWDDILWVYAIDSRLYLFDR